MKDICIMLLGSGLRTSFAEIQLTSLYSLLGAQSSFIYNIFVIIHVVTMAIIIIGTLHRK
jgi:hypothetical protein